MDTAFAVNIAEKLKTLPDSPGVYLMYDGAGQVIYVGKAVVLKNRVRQYFNNSPKPLKVQAMVDNVRDFGYILTLTEKDAFSLEANLVRKYMPRYNILLKDDKHSPYIKIDLKEAFPTVEITRKVKKDGAKYFGPYFCGIRVNDIAEIIRAAYKIRACPKKLKNNRRACLNYHLGLCSAPCEGLVGKDEYKKSVQKVVAFLSGRGDEAESLLTKKMEDAVALEQFERAIEYRDRLAMLKRLKERSISTGEVRADLDSIAYVCGEANGGADGGIVVPLVGGDGVENHDGEEDGDGENHGIASQARNDGVENHGIASQARNDGGEDGGGAENRDGIENHDGGENERGNNTPFSGTGAIAVNLLRGNKMMGVKNYPFSAAALNAPDALGSFVTQYYADNEIPDEILLNVRFDYAGLEEYLSALAGRKIRVACPQKGIKKRLTEMAEKNAAEYLAASADKIKRKADLTVGAAERLKNILGLESARRIECYDISNISGTDSVASGVVFIDGEASKRDYRRYKIKTVEGADDFASMREVILRRLKGDLPPPDLIVIDGGKGQLSSAISAAKEVGFVGDSIFISLAEKQELVFLPDKGEPLALSKNDNALKLLQRIRDEAHRFALAYHTRLRSHRLDSELLSIAGVGAKKREKLLKSLSFKEIKTLSAEEIVKRSGIDQKAAENIEGYFKKSVSLER